MNRQSLIYCLSALAAMVVVIVAGTAVLYHKDTKSNKSVDDKYGLAYAVPANAVAVFFLSEASDLDSPVFASFDFPSRLAEYLQDDQSGKMGDSRMVISLHYAGSLAPLYVFDAGLSSDEVSDSAVRLMDFARENGFCAQYVNCSELAPDSPLAMRSLVIIAKTNAQINVSKNQLAGGVSLMDAAGFRSAARNASEDALFISYDHARVLFEKTASRKSFDDRYSKRASAEYSAMASFFSAFASWAAVDLSKSHDLDIVQTYSETSDFMSVMAHASPSVSRVSEVLPYDIRFLLSLPMGKSSAYIAAYEDYLVSVQKIGVVAQMQEDLRKKTKVKPTDFIKRLGVTEVATASIPTASGFERVNLVRFENPDTLLLRGTGKLSLSDASDVLPYRFSEYIASVFGPFFNIADESCFTIKGSWLISGSYDAVAGCISDEAGIYTLKSYMAAAGSADLLSRNLTSCVAYLDVPKGDKAFADVLKKDAQSIHDKFKGDADYAPVVLSIYKKDGRMHTDITACQLAQPRHLPENSSKEASVEVPAGPFKVMNSGTGRENLFYQQKNGAVGLKELDGKGIWAVPFKETICGTVQNVDYYSNGNLQFVFGAGSKIYMMDRRGAYVTGFPKDLGKEIHLGPYVIEQDGEYKLFILHKDRTMEMYDLNGTKCEAWKGFESDDPIKGMPERLVVGGENFWVVRTSLQTLIYPLYGGEPLNVFLTNRFSPTAEVVVKNETTIEAECCDGRKRSMKLL